MSSGFCWSPSQPCYHVTFVPRKAKKAVTWISWGSWCVQSHGYPVCKDSYGLFSSIYWFEKRIRIVALFFLVVSDCFFLACCRVLPASSFPSWTVQTFQLSTLGDDICVAGIPPTMRVKSTNYLFILGEDPFIFTGISWDPGYTQSTILLRLASNSIHLCGWLIFRAWNTSPATLDYFGMIRVSYSTDHWKSVFFDQPFGTSTGHHAALRCNCNSSMRKNPQKVHALMAVSISPKIKTGLQVRH